MSKWFDEEDESQRLLAQETAILDATELVSEALEERGQTRKRLAEMLGVRPSEITQRLGGRNLTLRSLTDMLHVLGYELELGARDRCEHHPVWQWNLQPQPYEPPAAHYSGHELQVARATV